MGEGPVSDSQAMIAGMAPVLDNQSYVFSVLADDEGLPETALAVVREAEGTTVVLPTGLEGDPESFARITLQVHSDLQGVGLTAAVSNALAGQGIACNVIAGFYHDHLFVPWDRRDEALQILRELSESAGR
jgi:hypothetical protein